MNQDAEQTAPLAHYKVLDLSQGVAGPYCAHLLSRQGAEVVKVEPPDGDWARHVGLSREGQSSLSATYNAGKRSIAVDARQPGGGALLRRLAEGADVVIQNFRPQVVQRMGVDYDSLRAAGMNPVYVSISGYGPTGPYADRPATDSVMQADSGLMAANRDAQGRPQRVGLLLADIAAGVYAAQACTAALLGKARDGRGRHVQLNLFEVCCALQSTVLAENALCGGQPSAGVSAPNGVFAAADGFITLLALNNDQFERLCRALDLPHWLQDARFASNALRLAHKRELHAELDALIARHPRAWWEQRLDAQGALHASVQNLCDVVSHPQAAHLQSFAQLEQPGFGSLLYAASPWSPLGRRPGVAPRTGEHSAQILAEAGFDAQQVQALIASGVVRQSEEAA
ncbi:Formyl-coenzyme A transferase [Delftia tsuruhatensis]|uniref:CaiB/BaiF CoA transferase family protein n=1 Tax=Delftia tsuruhatensis TaxID=180282 RepID=UPI001E6C04AF|nr:CoA transferase [Delftia tsuruhatensis]CAB5682499.1 Formyl-coenzyme A transferase [Delftia tsuruhatensis]CAC9675802.1 Formyl-coenzyme A transferase [Delftia tsuruhatensis]